MNTAAARAWREGFTDQFVTDVETAIRTRIPNYAVGRMTGGQMNYLRDPAQVAQLKADLTSAEVLESQVLLTRTRASDHAPSPLMQSPSQAEIDEATPKLLPFVMAYVTFIEKSATERAAQPNDWGDLHCFIYLQGNRKLLTGEGKWLGIARDAGLGHLVEDSKLL